jgi:septal ring factor EnvC (AmiA/AmiB activator)
LLLEEQTQVIELARLHGQLVAGQRELARLTDEHERLAYLLLENERRSRATAQRSAQRRAALSERLRGIYILSRGGPARLLFKDEAMGAGLLRSRLLLRAAQRDQSEFGLFRQRLAKLQLERETLELRDRGRLARESHVQTYVANLRRQTETKQTSLARLRRFRVRAQARSGSLTPVEVQARRRLALSYARQTPSQTFVLSRGRLPHPVRGTPIHLGVLVTRDGSRKLRLSHPGLTYRVTRSAPVRAVASGTVRFVGPLKSMGRVVIIDHGAEFHSVYALLERAVVERIDRVQAGTVVGFAGIEPVNQEPALYFELRAGERALNAKDWLVRR